ILPSLALTLESHFSPILLSPWKSTLFPYTTLFRSRLLHSALVHQLLEALYPGQLLFEKLCSSDYRTHQQHPRCGSQCNYLHKNRSEEHTSELQSRENLVCRLLLEKKKRLPGGKSEE